VEEPDDVVEDRGHRLARGLGVPVGQTDGDLLVGTHEELGSVATVVHERIVEPSERRAGVEARVTDPVGLEEVHDDVRPVASGHPIE
jgi:hypothetical protein